MYEITPPYVLPVPQGGWRVADTRVSLASLVHAYWQGSSPETMVLDFPSLSLEQVHGAIAFYLRHRSEVDAFLVKQDSQWQQLREASRARHAPLLDRLRQAAASPHGK